MEMNLQMFAENTQTTAGLSAEMKTYYGMELLENAKPQLVHNQFAATKGLPAGGGKTVEWRKFGAFDKALKPLTEGVTPDGSGISVSYITKELAQYGDYTTVSDMLDLTAIDDVVLEITDRHGSNMGLTLDTVTRNEIQQGKQVIYAPKIGSDGTKTDVTSRMTLDKDCRMTSELVAKAGYDYAAVEVSSFQRKFSIEGIRHNLHTVRVLASSGRQARAILRDFRPDLVVGTGGYASYPMVKAAARAHLPTAVHESNMVPGLTTKMLESYADVIMVGFEDCRQHYKHPERIAVTGTPVRGDFFRLSREEARKKLGFDDEAPLVVSFWGSLGASHMNECMVDFFRREDAEGYPFRHIHAVGKGGWEAMEQKLRELGLPKSDRLDVRQYIYDMDVVMAAADVVLCRAGASTISELTALGKPTVMVPSPYVTNNHQEKNARILEKHGGARVILEKDATGEALYRAAGEILRSPELRRSMSAGMAELGIPDATERIYRTVMALRK